MLLGSANAQSLSPTRRTVSGARPGRRTVTAWMSAAFKSTTLTFSSSGTGGFSSV
jgi:hypothetical protein